MNDLSPGEHTTVIQRIVERRVWRPAVKVAEPEIDTLERVTAAFRRVIFTGSQELIRTVGSWPSSRPPFLVCRAEFDEEGGSEPITNSTRSMISPAQLADASSVSIFRARLRVSPPPASNPQSSPTVRSAVNQRLRKLSTWKQSGCELSNSPPRSNDS
jgi:hypothetical protein